MKKILLLVALLLAIAFEWPLPCSADVAYYGARAESGWVARVFDPVKGDVTTLPVEGDTVKVKMDANIREAFPAVIAGERGWMSAPISGILPSGSEVLVVGVKKVLARKGDSTEYYWIEFKR